MELMQAIYARRSVRAFSSQPLPRESIEALMQAAVQAPTGMNSQPWAFGVIEGQERLRHYSELTKKYLLENIAQFPMLEGYRAGFSSPDYNIFYQAPAVIIIFGRDAITTDFDCCLAAENLMLAALNYGLGSCWMGFFSFLLALPEIREELAIPPEYHPVAPIAIGYPEHEATPMEKTPPYMLFWQQ